MENEPDLVKIAALPLDRLGRLLIVKWKNKPIWFSLGGLLEEDETEEECLIREIKEEVNVDILGEPEHFCDTPVKKAAGREDTTIIIKFYLATLAEGLKVDDDEIEDYKWLSQKSYEELSQDKSIEIGSGLVKFAIPQLIEKGLMK